MLNVYTYACRQEEFQVVKTLPASKMLLYCVRTQQCQCVLSAYQVQQTASWVMPIRNSWRPSFDACTVNKGTIAMRLTCLVCAHKVLDD